ncbi:hypothetical protein ETU08_08875 [Apibacter muscae]|uniref:VanZ family protein n=1 Tax=Apibacter muscae TaxID=2509004 RepID=UPI0011AD2152|nr:VanZ family protein [Apibacter muscae]TWP28546.1 hypothetical protein ETU08_08875 [Apibacter muscae]
MLKNIRVWLHRNQTFLRIVLYSYFLLLTWLLLRGNSQIDNISIKIISTFYNDKVIHTIVFFILFILGRFAYPHKKPIIFLVLFSLYGILIEILQEFMNLGRTFEYLDMLADFIGCLFGLLIARLIIGFR